MSKLRGEGPSPPFSIAPKSFPEGSFETMPVLGCPSFEESYPYWLTSHPPGVKQGEVKGGRGDTPTRKISSVSLVAYGPKVFLLRFSHEGLQFLKPGRAVLNNKGL